MGKYTWNDVEAAIDSVLPVGLPEINRSNLILFGAGNAGVIALKELRQRNIPIAAFCDNDPAKHGKPFQSIPCLSLEAAAALENPVFLIAPVAYYGAISRQLRAYGVPFLFVDALSVLLNLDQLKSVYDDFLSDERSKHVFSALLLAKIHGSYTYCEEVYEDCFYYAPSSFKFRNTADVIVDCGAFVGDTIQDLIENRNKTGFSRIFAFEPGPRQFKALTTRVKRLVDEWALADDQIVCVNAGLGASSSKAFLSIEQPTALNIAFVTSDPEGSADASPIEIVALDDYFADRNDRISFIKADIEGSELEMLKGAAVVIRKYKPNIALSLYHKWEDFYAIPQYLKTLVPEYKIYIRHHGYLFAETVCYCSIQQQPEIARSLRTTHSAATSPIRRPSSRLPG